MFTQFQRFRRAESGIASVEFALFSTVLMLLFAGGLDLVYMVSAKRDTDRASMLIARAMTSCSSSSCMSDLINTYVPREANALIRYPTATIDLYMIQRQSGNIQTCSGTQRVLTDADVITTAKNIMRDDDVGAAVVMTTTYTSFLPKALLGYIGSGVSYRKYTVDVMGNIGSVC